MKINAILPCFGVLAIGLLASRLAHADQCQWIQEDSAQRLPMELPVGSEIVSYCAPCGDKQPGAPEEVASVEIRPTGEPVYQEVFVNGQPGVWTSIGTSVPMCALRHGLASGGDRNAGRAQVPCERYDAHGMAALHDK
jgi:hypothetical protein